MCKGDMMRGVVVRLRLAASGVGITEWVSVV